MSKVVRKVINIIVDVIVIAILIVSILIITLSLTSKSSGVPNLFGYAPLSVLSNSMEPEFSAGDLIISKVADPNTATYKVGDVVSFMDDINGEQQINTHRIIKIDENAASGVQTIYTKGDNAPDEDAASKYSYDILAVYTGKKIGGVGHVLGFLRTQLGFFLCVLLPMILFFVYEAIRVIMNIIAYNKEKAAEEAAAAVAGADLTEEQKQRAIAEYLAQQNASADTTQTKQDDEAAPPAAPAEETTQDSDAEVQTPASEPAPDPAPDTANAEPDENNI